jgi:hypothetical protein
VVALPPGRRPESLAEGGFDETPEGHALRYDADGDVVGITIVGARKLVDEHRDIHVQAPVTLPADAPAQVID